MREAAALTLARSLAHAHCLLHLSPPPRPRCSLKTTPSLQLSNPVLGRAEGGPLFYPKPAALRAVTEANLPRALPDLGIQHGAGITVTDDVLGDLALALTIMYTD